MNSNNSIYIPRTATPANEFLGILGAGTATIGTNQEYPPREHQEDHYFRWQDGRTLNEYQAILITEGRGYIETSNTEPLEFEAPILFILFPGIWHRYKPTRKTGWKEYWIAFDGDYAKQLQESKEIEPTSPFFHVGHNESLLSQYQLILKEVEAEAFGYRKIAASAIIQILALATSLPKRSKEESHPMRSVIRKACFLMRERASISLSPEDLASELNVGYTYFRRLFKQYTGISPKRYHAQLRLHKAKTLLRDSNLTINEIATALDFDNQFHLSSWFKKQVGTSPKDWR